jgi:hypothetical protein
VKVALGRALSNFAKFDRGVRKFLHAVLWSAMRPRIAFIESDDCDEVRSSKLKEQESQQATGPVYESRLPKPLARLKRWLVAHHMTLLAIADTPHSIALGSAIGVFFGFTPLYPLKTLLSIAVAWVCRCNKIAAAIAVTLHDVMIWAMPALYLTEYHLGCWILNRPAAQRVHFRQFRLHDYVHWHVFSRIVWPTFWPAFVGSLLIAVPSAIVIYVVMRLLISRGRALQKTS